MAEIVVIGAEGSIGKRWCAVVEDAGHTAVRYDKESKFYVDGGVLIMYKTDEFNFKPNIIEPSHVIVATPTNAHVELCEILSEALSSS